jgi:hypothetical protein
LPEAQGEDYEEQDFANKMKRKENAKEVRSNIQPNTATERQLAATFLEPLHRAFKFTPEH